VIGGVCSKEVSEGGPVIGCNGETTEQRCATERSVAKSSSPLFNERMRETGYGEHLGGLKSQESDSGVYLCHAIHQCSEEEGSGCEDPQSSGTSKWRKEANTLEPNVVHEEPFQIAMTSKTSPEIRRLRDHGTPTTHPKWRSNRGMGSLHQGLNSSSKLSHYSFA